MSSRDEAFDARLCFSLLLVLLLKYFNSHLKLTIRTYHQQLPWWRCRNIYTPKRKAVKPPTTTRFLVFGASLLISYIPNAPPSFIYIYSIACKVENHMKISIFSKLPMVFFYFFLYIYYVIVSIHDYAVYHYWYKYCWRLICFFFFRVFK